MAATDWIKVRTNLWDDPRIGALCDKADVGEATIVGGLYWLWATADSHSAKGQLPGMTLKTLDRKTGIAGFGDALVSIGWLYADSAGLTILKFEEHNGASAKKRAEDAKRKALSRGEVGETAQLFPAPSEVCPQNSGQKAAPEGQKSELEEDKNKKKNKPNVKPTVGQEPDGSGSADKAITDAETIEGVFAYWRKVMDSPKSQLDDKRKGVIRRALKAGYSPRDLCRAIQGCSLTPHNQGVNERSQKYLGIHVCLKDADQIDRFIANAVSPPAGPKSKAQTQGEQLDAAAEQFAANMAAKYGTAGAAPEPAYVPPQDGMTFEME